jgi:ATP-dependent DNA helicase RecG
MNNVKTASAYLSIIEEISKLRPSTRSKEPFTSFISNSDAASDSDLYGIYRLLTGEYRGLVEQAGLDPDMIPAPAVAPIRLDINKGDSAELVPDVFIITSLSTDTELQTSISRVPTSKVISQYKKWEITSHPSVVPMLREVVKKHRVEITPGALTNLKILANGEAKLGKLRYGPRKTIDCELYVTATDFADSLKRISDARLLEGSKLIYRMPASKISEIIKIIEYSPYIFDLEPAIENTISGASTPIVWDGSFSGLGDIKLEGLHTLTPAAKKRLIKAGYTNAHSLLTLAPRKYVDRSNPQLIATLQEGESAAIIATVKSVRVLRQKRMVSYTINDGRANITVTFFNALWLANKFAEGDRVLVYGKVSSWGKGGQPRLGFNNPIMEHLADSKLSIFGIYPQANGVTTEDIRSAINEILDRLVIDSKENLSELLSAFNNLHRPESLEQVATSRRRLAYEELLGMQVMLAVEKEASSEISGISNAANTEILQKVIEALPYDLTSAQASAWKEISQDLESAHPMHRLLQGDVGSGKTTVALLSIIQSILNGNQVAVLAPTEILASQLYSNFADALQQLESSGVVKQFHIQQFTNKLRGKAKSKALEELAMGDIQVAVGTHALLSEGVDFENLGLVIVDEQHRFGVQQRAQLSESRSDNLRPDTLVMTATPIPRTAALTVFGALDVSTLDELPPGRTPIETHWIDNKINLESPKTRAWSAIRKAVERGEQAYVVCPLVEESESLNVASATETFESLRSGALEGLSIGLMHGQMKFDERTEVMSNFRSGDIDVLVATTVIEVGVNVPNASIIVILDPQRFGMAQLHQLRGRVGRSDIKSECYLYGSASGDESRRRLKALTDSTDGFLLSEVDLEIRGPGQVFGSAQSGISDLNLADLSLDSDLLEKAKQEASYIVSKHSSRSVSDYARESALSPVAAAWLRKS